MNRKTRCTRNAVPGIRDLRCVLTSRGVVPGRGGLSCMGGRTLPGVCSSQPESPPRNQIKYNKKCFLSTTTVCKSCNQGRANTTFAQLAPGT
eukprot:1017567-Rhodomonas_salina.1